MNSKYYNFTIEDLINGLKVLARTIYWQSIYAHFKEGNLQLFENVRDLTSIQIEFLYLLSCYYSIITDVGAGLVDEAVLKNSIRIEAYSYYKNKKLRDEQQKIKAENFQNKAKNNMKVKENWIFKVPKQKRK